jgi:glycosyltransferase involved in cell wall biosynthesis
LANNAVGARPNEEVLIGEDPEEYAAHILRLLDDETLRKRIATNGNRFVRSHFDWDVASNTLSRLIGEATTAAR